MKNKHILMLLVAIFIGTLAAMLAWTLIVKQVVQSQLASTGTTGTLGSLSALTSALNL